MKTMPPPTIVAYLQQRSPVERRRADEDHAVARDRRRRRVVDVVHLEDDLAVGSHRDPVSVGQRQLLGVVQHRVEVLDPDGVHRSVQYQPHVVA